MSKYENKAYIEKLLKIIDTVEELDYLNIKCQEYLLDILDMEGEEEKILFWENVFSQLERDGKIITRRCELLIDKIDGNNTLDQTSLESMSYDIMKMSLNYSKKRKKILQKIKNKSY